MKRDDARMGSVPLFPAPSDARNKFCALRDLENESDVEQFLVVRLLAWLGYADEYVRTKAGLDAETIGKARRKRQYVPDYVCFGDAKQARPVVVVDAKSPLESAEEGVRDAQLYASVIHRRLEEPKPSIYCIGTSGTRTIVKHFDREKPEFDLLFEEFVDGNAAFEAFFRLLSREGLSCRSSSAGATFEFIKPGVDQVRGIFEACHYIIWRKEKMSPQAAFYEFSKLMFVKLREDKKLRGDPEVGRLIEARQPLPREKVIFSLRTISQNEPGDPNPINSMFRRLRDDLEHAIKVGRKKRIFDRNEELNLKPSTVKEVTKYLEHYDLYGIDEDLNGRLFETFLSATMRGRELGQFFTPRSVVDFMTKLADPVATRIHVDLVADLCCGTAGFLIEAMAVMTEKIQGLRMLGGSEQDRLLGEVRDERLLGVDAGKNPPVARIARINMYLHGDGGSHIYFADALDKRLVVEEGLEPELRAEREELRVMLGDGLHAFDLGLTNPPFAMRYKSGEPDEREILEQYALAWRPGKDGSRRLKPSLKSNVMFLERYCDLLTPGGRLCTIIDESVLNTETDRDARGFILANFLVKAVISLPQWAFFQAGSNVKTSILFLAKKRSQDEEQPHTFYARCENIGYDYQRPDPAKSELPAILNVYNHWEKSGELPVQPATHWSQKSRHFVQKLGTHASRFDFEHLDPRHTDMDSRLRELAKERGYVIATIGDLCDVFRGKTADRYVSTGVPIVKVRNVTGEGINWNDIDFVLREFFDANPNRHLKPQDVLLTSTGVGTIGRSDILETDLPCMTDSHVTVLRVNPGSSLAPRYLLYYLRSIFGQMQMDRYTVGSTGQTELNRGDVDRIMVVYPGSIEGQAALTDAAHSMETAAMQSRDKYEGSLMNAKLQFAESLGLSR